MAKKQIFAAVVISVASFFVFGQKAHAATINVVAGNDGVVANGQCQLSEAIQNVSNQAATYPDCIAGNGSDYAISLSNGVITLTSNLANATRGLKIIGASKAGTTMNANGFIGLIMALSPVKTYDVTLENLTLNGALDFGFSIQSAKNVVMKNVKTDNSDSGVKIVGADLISLNDCDITNNNNPLTNGDQNAGLTIEDSNSITISGLKIINNKVSSTGSAVSGLSMIGAKNTLIKNTTIMGNTSSLASGL